MSNYTKTTDFAIKDTLTSGDTDKIIRGSEFEVEFDEIAEAIATKADTDSPTFTGTVTIPTAAVTTFSLGGTTVTSTAAELNLLDGVTATTAELNYVDGVTSAIQTQLDAKAPTASPTLTGTTRVPQGDALLFGETSAQRLKIYTSGQDTYIDELNTNTSNLNIRNNDSIRFKTITGNKNRLVVGSDDVHLYYDNVEVLNTQNYGVNVIGRLDCDGLRSDGDVTFFGETTESAGYDAVWDASMDTFRITDNAVLGIGFGDDLKIYHDGTDNIIEGKPTFDDVIRLKPRATAPSSPVAGDIYYDSTDNKLKCYNGTTFKDLY